MLQVGDKVPDFTLPLAKADGTKAPVAFSSLLAKGPVVIAFYPLAFTGTCTQQVCDLRDGQAELHGLRATVVGFSIDTPASNVQFAKLQGLEYGLYCDPNRSVVDRIWETMTVIGVDRVATRGVLVVKPDGTVAEKWVAADPDDWIGRGPIEAALAKLA